MQRALRTGWTGTDHGPAPDVVVVGSGPGGASVARDLARAGARVLVLERGGAAVPSGRARQVLRELWLPGRSLTLAGPPWSPVAVLRACTLGGSSMYFFGTAWEPPYAIMDAAGIDLRADADALRAELAPAPLPAELTGPRARLLAAAAVELGHRWQPIPKFVDQEVLRRDGPAAYGAARWTARRFLDDAAAAGARIRTGVCAQRLLTSGGRVQGVVWAGAGRHGVVRAPTIVLAAGALGSPGLLRGAGVSGAKQDWFYDPVVAINGVVAGLDAGFEPPMCGAVTYEDAGFMVTDLCRPRWMHEALTVAGGQPRRLGAYRRTASLMVKVRDELSGSAPRSVWARKPLTPLDRARLDDGAQVARQILERAGARAVHATARVAVHPGGTARIGQAVNADLATEVEGLHVCDASVLPAAWGVPPTFTILALGRRLARHLSTG